MTQQAGASERQMATPTEAAQLLGVHRHTILRRIAAGSIPASRISQRKLLIPLAWLHETMAPASPPTSPETAA